MNMPLNQNPIPVVVHKIDIHSRRKKIIEGLVFALVIAAVAGLWYWLDQQKYVYTDKAEISAPLIKLTPSSPGALMKVFVEDGDSIVANQAVARVGDEILTSKVAGLVIDAKQDIGAIYRPGDAVVTMIEPQRLRVVAKVQEDKGLTDIHKDQQVTFTVDAFGSQKFNGVVENVSATKSAEDVVFSISDKRAEQDFDIKIKYDNSQYKGFQNGMSAKVWIVK